MTTYFKLLLTAMFWGGTWIAGKIVAKNLGPFSAAFLRFAIASSILLVVARKIEGRLPPVTGRQIVAVILLGLTGIFAYNYCFFQGLKFINAGRSALIVTTNPIFITVLSSYIFKEKLNWIKFAGIMLSASGAVIVISRGNPFEIVNGNIGRGELYIFGCVLSWVTYSLIGKAVMARLSPIVAVTYSTVIGTAALLVPAYWEGVFQSVTHYSKLEWVCLFYLGFFGTVLGFLWYYEGIKKIGATKASQFINLVPITAILLAFFLLHEPITPSLAAGAALVIFGIYMTNSSL